MGPGGLTPTPHGTHLAQCTTSEKNKTKQLNSKNIVKQSRIDCTVNGKQQPNRNRNSSYFLSAF